jgi:hypothetical protein
MRGNAIVTMGLLHEISPNSKRPDNGTLALPCEA